VLFEGDFALGEEDCGGVGGFFADALALEVGLGFGEAEAEDDDEDGRAGAEPEELGRLMGWREEGGKETRLTGRQPWPTVSTKARAKTVARR